MEAKLEWLDDPRIFRVGKLSAHSDHDVTGVQKNIKRAISQIRYHWMVSGIFTLANHHVNGQKGFMTHS